MCLTYCHRLKALYWNHEDCEPDICCFAAGPHGRCDACRHSRKGLCVLTNAPLPATEGRGGCCHWNVTPVQGWQVVTREMLAPLGIGPTELDVAVLKSLEAPYRWVDGQPVIDPDALGLPSQTYGLGTEHHEEEVWDWSDWSELWRAAS